MGWIARHKYDIGMRIDNYEIIGFARYVYKRRIYLKYILKCLTCGSLVERRSSDLGKNIKCPTCVQNMVYYRFNVGDVVNGLEILEKQKVIRSNSKTQRAYLCRCVVDGYTSVHTEDNLLKNKGCPVCAGIVIMRGFNDIHTVAPWLGALLEDPEDGYKHWAHSHTKLKFRCPDCGTVTRPIAVYNVYEAKRINCRKCGDGVSTPEKIMYGVLEQLCLDFDYQKQFEWSQGKLYDFYIPSMNMIIETHGLQHYRDMSDSWGSLDDIQQNDALKRTLAKSNNIVHYIEIDCSDASPMALVNAYKTSLSTYFDLGSLDFDSIILYGLKSFCIRAGDLWNAGDHNVLSISQKLQIRERTIRTYLKTLMEIRYLNVSYPIKNIKGEI